MKLTAILLLTVCMQVAARSHGQTVSLSLKNASMKQVFREIQKQTGLNVLVDESLLEKTGKITVKMHNVPVEEALDICLRNQPLRYAIEGGAIAIKAKLVETLQPVVNQVASIEVKGTVTDEKGAALSGASIKLKGSSTGTSTDNNGNFILQLPDKGGILIISFVGYQTIEIPVSKTDELRVILKQADMKVEEVVVVGYGTQKKVNLTGAVATTSGKDIQDLPVTNLTNTLAGRLPGLIATNGNGKPGSGSAIQIRGRSTLNNNTSLVVVDGIVRADGFDRVNPEDVANITILKDAASTAVYGARAGNGVILVTTKRGSTGDPIITYTGNVAIQNPINYPKLFNAYQYGTKYNEALINQGFDPNSPTQSSRFFRQSQIDSFKNNIGTTDWYDASFRKNSPQTNQTLSLSGGTNRIKYFLSLGYVYQGGMFDNISFKQYSFRSNIDAKISKDLKMSLNLEGRQGNNVTPGTSPEDIFRDVVYQRPTTLAYFADGRPSGNNNGQHPIEEIQNSGYSKSTPKVFTGTLTLEQGLSFITRGLSIKGLAAVNTINIYSKTFLTPFKVFDQSVSGTFTERTVGLVTSLDESYSAQNYYTLNLSLNYDRTFNGLHYVSGLLLAEQYQADGNAFNGHKENFITNVLPVFDASGTNNQTINGNSSVFDRRRSVVGRINYVYDNKYLLEGSFRSDGSYRFAPGHQYGFFPAVSIGWRISEEDFFKQESALKFISNLKLRLSKGLVGNDRVSAFQYENAYTINTSSGNPVFDGQAVPETYYGVYPNKMITWEKQNSNNIGLDGAFFNSKLNLTFDYFFRTTKDILFARDRSIPATFGRSLPSENYAEMKSNGLELNINYENKVDKLEYNIGVNGSFVTNKVTKIDDPANALDYQKQLGRIFDFISGYESVGFFQSNEDAQKWYGGKQFGITTRAGEIKYADVNGDGEITSLDQKILTNNNYTPRIMYGINGGLSWKGFYFNFLFQGAAKRTVLISDNGSTWSTTRSAPAYLADSWSPNNIDAEYPLIWNGVNTINDRTSSVWLKDAAYIRLKASTLGYQFDNRKLKSMGINGLQVYFVGTNLLTFSKFKAFDPEAESGGLGYYPQQRNLSLGIKASF